MLSSIGEVYSGKLRGNPKRKVNKLSYLVLSISLLLFGLIVLNIMRTQRTTEYLYLADRYHQLQKDAIKLKYILDSYDLGVGKPKIITKSQVSPMDGMTMIYIPAGEFLMGNDHGPTRSTPEHTVYLDAYWIDQTEVTNEMYALCVEAGVCWQPVQSKVINPYYDNPRYVNYPVVYINWQEAVQYCTWANRRLPTEAEWEKAARGTDGRKYPWGDEKPNSKLLNYQDNIGAPLPVDRYPSGASPYGVLNMAGNVREWVADWYDNKAYQEDYYLNPLGLKIGTEKSLRGGHFSDSWQQVYTYNRFSHEPESAGLARGFRCVADE
jgi:formylglycine-generating enzyme required for sulfatase activity